MKNPFQRQKSYNAKQHYGKDRSQLYLIVASVASLMVFYFIVFILVSNGMIQFTQFQYFDLVFVAVLFLMGPMGFYNHMKNKKKRDIQDQLPDFLTEIGNSVSAGMTVVEAINVAADGDYGKLTPEIKKMRAELSWSVPVKQVFQHFAKRLKSSLVDRIVVTINRGLEMGGNTEKVFKAAAKEIEQVKQVEKQRKTNMATYSVVIIMSFLVFLAVILIIDKTIFASFFELQEKTAGAQLPSMQLNAVDPSLLKYSLYSFVFVHSMGAGMLSGFMMDGDLSSGIRYSFILVLVSFFVFKFLF